MNSGNHKILQKSVKTASHETIITRGVCYIVQQFIFHLSINCGIVTMETIRYLTYNFLRIVLSLFRSYLRESLTKNYFNHFQKLTKKSQLHS